MVDNNKTKGIDIVQAMNILSLRSQNEGEGHGSTSSDACPCCNGVKSRHEMEKLRTMGQKIDIDQSGDDIVNSHGADETLDADNELEKAKEEQRKAEERFKKLSKLSQKDLLYVVMKAQEERTLTYLEYERKLVAVLVSRNLSQYVEIVANVTAAFSIQSNLINSAKECFLKVHDNSEISASIKSLQEYEKEKLNLTAALHLEKIR